jgi:hypothetical protein
MLAQKRRVISASSELPSIDALRGSSAMPHLGQFPGSLRTTSGCIGQVYSTASFEGGARASRAMPHFGQLPGDGWRISGCIGQV